MRERTRRSTSGDVLGLLAAVVTACLTACTGAAAPAARTSAKSRTGASSARRGWRGATSSAHSATAPPATAQPTTAQPTTAHPTTAQPTTAQPTTAGPVRGPGTWRTVRVTVPDELGYRTVLVYTPDVARPELLPVLYVLHGLPSGIEVQCGPQAGRELDAAFLAGARPFLMACPDAGLTAHADSEWADSTDGDDLLETFAVSEARKAVEGDHPRPASMRAIAGMSMGGFAAASFALRHPDLYSQVVPLAGYFVIDDPDHVFGTTPTQLAAHNPMTLVSHARGQRWFVFQAQGDTSALTSRAGTSFVPKLRAAGAQAQLFTTPGPHSSQWAVEQIPVVARLLSPGWGRT